VGRAPGIIVAALLLACAGCGGSSAGQGGSGSGQTTGAANVLAVTLDDGPAHNYTNGAFTTVTVCVPGSATNCQTIGGILVDTGSSGLRLLSSQVNGALTLGLPAIYPSGGQSSTYPLGECAQSADLSYTWGSLRRADVHLAGDMAHSVPVNVMGDPDMPPAPPDCASSGADNDSLQALGANGILGVGTLQQDCGTACASGGSPPPAAYYECPFGAACASTFVSLADQVQNPVALFATDNNGIILRLPDVTSAQTGAAGTLAFGIGTQSNNALGSAKVFRVDGAGNFLQPLVYDGNAFAVSFIDSGSNGIFFNSSGMIPVCRDYRSFYCPASPLSLSATVQDINNGSDTVTFGVANADQLLANPNASVLPDLAGPNIGFQTFDFGLPFFFGRSVYVGIASKQTSAATGPFWAF